jgi:hypothetical protein
MSKYFLLYSVLLKPSPQSTSICQTKLYALDQKELGAFSCPREALIFAAIILHQISEFID